MKEAESQLWALHARSGGRIVPRRRPTKSTDMTNTCTVFLDECGQYSLSSRDEFGAFVLSAVIIRDDDSQRIDEQWRQWKTEKLGAASKLVHEPDVRKGKGSFWFQGNKLRQSQARESLSQILSELDFMGIVCVMNRPAYIADVGLQPLDNSLPTHPYLMTLDFLMERLVMVLEQQFGGARAHVVAEARGLLEDARLQSEFTRLFLEGTTYISASWFRQALAPGIDFKIKKDNITGLQLTDLLARPCGEKVLNPLTTPDRWSVFRTKLCQGQETAHSILGLKIVPWDERYDGIWGA
ncbi:MAG: hypothetical protein HW388_336 [Dehalococcoidia bacterium]|nr:hypothetical protein [Dehalococcoidia bacterium]